MTTAFSEVFALVNDSNGSGFSLSKLGRSPFLHTVSPDVRRLSPWRSRDLGQFLLTLPSISFKVKPIHLLTPPHVRRTYQPLLQDKPEESLNGTEHCYATTTLFSCPSYGTLSCPDRVHSVARNNQTKRLLRVDCHCRCTALDSSLPISLGFRSAQFVWFPTDFAKLELPGTDIDFDLRY